MSKIEYLTRQFNEYHENHWHANVTFNELKQLLAVVRAAQSSLNGRVVSEYRGGDYELMVALAALEGNK